MLKKKHKLIIKLLILVVVYYLLAVLILSPSLASYVYLDNINKSLTKPLDFGFKFYNIWFKHYQESKIVGAMNLSQAEALKYGGWAFLLPLVSPPVFLLIMGLLALILKPKKSIHGNDRFANDKDLENSGFFTSSKIESKYPDVIIGKAISGRYKGEYIKYNGQQFLMLYAPTRSGKGVGIVIPNCLFYSDSIVVLDIKLENFRYSAGHRKDNLHQDVFLFCPEGYRKASGDNSDDANIPRSHKYNPLYYISRKHSERSTDLLKISSILFDKTGGENDMWTGLSEDLFRSLVLYLLDCETETDSNGKSLRPVNLGNVFQLSIPESGVPLSNFIKSEIQERNSDENKEAWKEYIRSNGATEKPKLNVLDTETVKLFYQFTNQPIKQQQSIMLTFNSKMSMFSNPVTAEATSDNDFDFKKIREKKMSIYLGLSADGLKMYQTLNNLFFSQLIGQNVKQGMLPDENKKLKYQCLMVLDEFASLGRVSIIEEAVAFTAGYNMRFMFILQDSSQLERDSAYKKDGARTIINNCAVELIYPPKVVDEAVKKLSESIGYYDYKTKTRSKNKSSGKNGNTSITVGETVNKRAVMNPSEIINLREVKHDVADFMMREIIVSEFCRPFIANKVVYFDEPYFQDRKIYSENNVPEIPKLCLKQNDLMEFVLSKNRFEDDREII